jgi:putative SOS response-associated peptidase YedK
MTRLHDRQPVILDPDAYEQWLAADTPKDRVKELPSRTLDSQVEFHRVSRDVNSYKFTGTPQINPL